MKLEYLIGLTVISIVGNFLFRRWNKAFSDRMRVSDPESTDRPIQYSEAELKLVDQILGKYRLSSTALPNPYLKNLHPSYSNIFSGINEISFSPFYQVYSTDLIKTLYEHNPDFTRIGYLSDGSDVLARISRSDPVVYYVDSDEGNYESPTPYAITINDYIYDCYIN